MSATALGRRYANALIGLAADESALERVLKDLEALQEAWDKSEALKTLVANPAAPRTAVKQVFEELLKKLGAHRLVINTLSLMAERGRARFVPEVIEAYAALAEARTGRVRAEVTTATAMPESYFQQLHRKLEQLTGSSVLLVKKEDPSLIAGVVTRVGDKIFDGSVHHRLTELKENLLQ